MDIFVVVVLILSTVHGCEKGFALTVKSFLHWFMSLIIAVLFCSFVKELLIDYTIIDDIVYERLLEHFGEAFTESSAYQILPDICATWIDVDANTLSETMALSITSFIMTIFGFLAVILGVKFICYIFTIMFSKKHHKGLTGFVDGLLGLVFGFARGIFYVLLIFLLFIPLFTVWFPNAAESVALAMEDSFVAGILYNDNIFLIILKEFFSL